MNKEMDPMGRAIAEYHKTKKASKLRVFSPMFEEDEIPLSTLFRSYKAMPEIEQKAIDMAKGRVLDVGAGAGCHSVVLQENALDVTFFTLDGQKYDTILMLMNGIGIVGTLERMPEFFKHLDKILAPGGQLLCDSSDISFVFDGEIPDDMGYYGEQKQTATWLR